VRGAISNDRPYRDLKTLNERYRLILPVNSFSPLDRFRAGIHGSRDIVGFFGERLARLERDLLVFRTNLANDVVPAVVPGDAGLTVHHRPGSMVGAEGFMRLAISFDLRYYQSSPSLAS